MTNANFVKKLIRDVEKLPFDKQQELSKLIKEWSKEKDGRSHQRKSVNIPIQVVTDDQLFKENTKDISASGTFVNLEDCTPFEQDQSINLIFNMPVSGRAFKLNGRIVRIENRGIAVQYENLTPPFLAFIEEELCEKGL